MSKKKKKIVRPHYTSKELRIKQAPKKPVPKELKFGIIFCVCALILAVVLFFVLYDDGSLAMQDDKPVLGAENWLVADVGTSSSHKYYHIGEVEPLPGYTLDEESLDQNNLRVYTYRPDDPDSQINHYYVTGINRVPEVNAEAANANYKLYGGMDISDVQKMTMQSHEVDFFTTATPVVEDTDTYQQMIFYMPAIRNTTVLISISVDTSPDKPPMDTETLLALVDDIMETITLVEK